jgi:hypothetical protein
MSKEPFDPFDDNNRDKRPRRRSADVMAERRDWNDRIDREMRKILENFNDAEYIKSKDFLEIAMLESEYYTYIKRNLNTAFLRLKYVKMRAKTTDGRWKIDGINTHVYKKSGEPDLELSQLKQYFE